MRRGVNWIMGSNSGQALQCIQYSLDIRHILIVAKRTPGCVIQISRSSDKESWRQLKKYVMYKFRFWGGNYS